MGAKDIWIDIDLDEVTVAGIIDQVLVGRWPWERPIRLIAGVDARLADLARRYPAKDSLRELIARRKALREAVELLVAAAGFSVEELVHPVITERWFCLAGDPPDVEAILGVMRSRGIEAQLEKQFPQAQQEAPWCRIVIDAAAPGAVRLQVFRRSARWRTRGHGTFRQEIRHAIATVPASARPQLRRQLGATRFIIGALRLWRPVRHPAGRRSTRFASTWAGTIRPWSGPTVRSSRVSTASRHPRPDPLRPPDGPATLLPDAAVVVAAAADALPVRRRGRGGGGTSRAPARRRAGSRTSAARGSGGTTSTGSVSPSCAPAITARRSAASSSRTRARRRTTSTGCRELMDVLRGSEEDGADREAVR